MSRVKDKEAGRNPGLAQKLFDTPDRGGMVSLRVLKQFSPSNPNSRVSFFIALHLMDQGELAHTIHEQGLAAIRESTSWIKAFELLETKGIRQGIHFREVSEVLEVTPQTAKRACQRASREIFAIYGLHIGFFPTAEGSMTVDSGSAPMKR